MKTFKNIVNEGSFEYQLELPFDERIKSRIIADSPNGETLAVNVPRGQILRDGTLIADDEGNIVRINSAKENVTTVFARTPHKLLQIAYHLGNRHVMLQIGDSHFLRYQSDHVLDEMVTRLGGIIKHELEQFEPENGAYAGHSHAHEHHHHEHS